VKSPYFYTIIICLIVMIFTGCATAKPTVATPKPLSNMENALITAVDQAFLDITSKSRIAVIHMQAPNDNVSNFLLGELQHILTTRRLNVAERVDLDRVRAEHELQYSGEVDDNTAVDLGKFVGADLVVTGGIDGEGSFRRLRLKIIDTQTALIKSTASVPYVEDEKKEESTKETVKAETPPRYFFKLFLGFGSTFMSGLETDKTKENYAKVNDVFGLNTGLSAEIKLWDTPFMLEPGARYSLKVTDYELPLWGDSAYYREWYNYIDYFAKLNLRIQALNTLSVQPWIGYGLGTLMQAQGDYEIGDLVGTTDITDACNKVSHLYMFGFDITLRDSFYFGVEYDISPSNVWKDDYAKIKLDALLFTIGAKF